jgi:murein L,D-transpeptidase YafK
VKAIGADHFMKTSTMVSMRLISKKTLFWNSLKAGYLARFLITVTF